MTVWDRLPATARHRARRGAAGCAPANHNQAAPRTASACKPPVPAHTDTGCSVAPSCLRCPLALCIYEDPRGPRAAKQAGRDHEIWRLYRTGWSTEALASRHGLSRRQVFRILARVRAEQAQQARQLPLPLDLAE